VTCCADSPSVVSQFKPPMNILLFCQSEVEPLRQVGVEMDQVVVWVTSTSA